MTITTNEWLQLNLALAPTARLPATTYALGKRPSSVGDLQREIIDFDSDGPEGAEFLKYARAATGLSQFSPIPWPHGKEPKPVGRLSRRSDAPLPKCDVLIVTWTMDEGHALSRVLTPGLDSRDDWKPYTHHFGRLAKLFRKGSPATDYGRLGTYWITTIAGKQVLCFKSDSHLSQDGPKLPNFAVWRQLVSEVDPGLVITTGTGGGIGEAWEVGDVVVSQFLRFDCRSRLEHATYAGAPLANQSYRSERAIRRSSFKQARTLFRANAAHLPNTNARKIPEVFVSHDLGTSVVTTDFFGFDNVQDTYGLQGLGSLSEMGDAVLGAVMKPLGKKAPVWVAVRNVSDPEINEPRAPIKTQAHDAALIYKAYGKWSSVCSAIVCWALIV